ncbi:hypothetical protein DICVIV_01860 [Dictyocaulus viviparus]|uniref:Insulin-like domain-containing protein n=1 Tax=Dictyocaulus viviparus TaxID=29172 RepID=A0A0D8Y7K5_DICVI|nr:hypothetical protein DICVIV_01860 [Dictyocaulus viviparus]
MLLSLTFTLVHSLYYNGPVVKSPLDEDLAYNNEISMSIKQHQPQSVHTRDRRARLCGKKIIEQLLILCDSCILPVGSEIAKRSIYEENLTEAVHRLMKRELSIATKCCAGQCKLSELEKLCCKKG